MKRFAAIQGPTPMFVRWALEYPCELREISAARFIESSFRQLRSFRELSLARIENRMVEGVAIHPDASIDHLSAALGFSETEVCFTAGGLANVDRACSKCPANVANNLVNSVADDYMPSIWAGCFGFLTSDIDFDWLQMIRGRYLGSELNKKIDDGNTKFDLINLFQESLDQKSLQSELEALFGKFPNAWSTIWSVPTYNIRQLELIREIVSIVQYEISNQTFANHFCQTESTELALPVIRDLDVLKCGIEAAIKHRFPFHAELVPSGFVEGQAWTIPRHCRRCKSRWNEGSGCLLCRELGQMQEVINLKVIGIRPYLQLESILGRARVTDLLSQWGIVRQENAGRHKFGD